MMNEFEYIVFTVFYSDVDTFVSELSTLLNVGTGNAYEIGRNCHSVKDVYFPAPPPGGVHMSKILVWEPVNLYGRTAFINNYRDGLYSLVYLYCCKFHRKAIQIAFSNKKMEYPAYKLNFFDFSRTDDIERTIYLIKDGSKWEFYTSGSQQSFEDVSNYEKKKKTERFNKEIILDYLLKLGIDISDERFWYPLTKATCIEQKYWPDSNK